MPDQDPFAAYAVQPSGNDPFAAFVTEQSPQEKAPSLVDAALMDNPSAGPVLRGGQALARMFKANPVAGAAMVGAGAGSLATGGALAPVLAPWALGMAGAGLGAAGGAGAAIAGRQVASGTPEQASSTLGTMAKEGGAAALGQGAGSAVTGLAKAVAPKLANGVLKVGKGLQNEFGKDNIVSTFLKERLPVGQSAKAGALVGESAAKADDMIAAAQAGGASPVSVRELATEVGPVRDTAKLRVKLGRPDETPAVAARIKSIKKANPNGIALTDAQELKREAQKLSSRTFRAIDRGADVNDIGALTEKGVAAGLKKGIEARVPGVQDVNTRTQSLMGLEEALSDAESRSPGFMGTNPITWLGAVAPGAGSHIAFGADAVSKAPMGGAFRNALLAALAGLENGADGPK